MKRTEMKPSSRRNFLKSAAACAPAAMLQTQTRALQRPASTNAADDGLIPVGLWPQQFDVDQNIINLENGYWGLMPRSTMAVYVEKTAYINRYNSIWGRGVLPGDNSAADYLAARGAIAGMMHCDVDEIAITRSGTEGLQSLIVNYRHIKPGDAVICCDLDYDTTLSAINFLGDHRGATVVQFNMPEPATTANILAAYEGVLRRTPNAKLMLVTQVSHRTGLVTPVNEIVHMARARGVDCIVDIAHGVACLDFTLADLPEVDFAAWSVHKWTMAPLGLGAMFIRKSRLPDIEPSYDNHEIPETDISARVPAGVINSPAVLTIPAAIDFYHRTGGKRREDHLRSLRDRWVHAVRDIPEVEIAVPDDPARYCALTSFRLAGMKTEADAHRVQHRLFDKYRIHTVWRKGAAKGPVVRVTPGLYNTVEDSDALAVALRAERRMLL